MISLRENQHKQTESNPEVWSCVMSLCILPIRYVEIAKDFGLKRFVVIMTKQLRNGQISSLVETLDL